MAEAKTKEGELIPNSSVRKSLFKPEYTNQLIDLMSQGKTASQVAAEFGIARRTLYYWFEGNPDFKEAYGIAKTGNEAFLETLLQSSACGNKKINIKAVELLGRNSHGWGKEAQSGPQTINIENMNINKLSQDELEKKAMTLVKEIEGLYGQETDNTEE